MEANRTIRILRLLMMLSGTKRYSMREMESRLGMSARNIRRDFETIETAGFILERDNGYRLSTDDTDNKNLKNLLHFSEEEASILYQTLSMIEGDSPVKERLVRKMNTFYDLKVLEQLRQTDDLTKVQTIRQSIKEKKQVRLVNYRSSNSNSIEDRNVEAFDFLPDYRTVWCYDPRALACKQFKLARMQSVELLPTGWRYPEKHQKPFTDIFRISATVERAKVELHLSLKAYNLLIEEYPLAAAHIKPAPPGYLLKAPVAGFSGISRFVLGLPGEIEIIKPVALKKYIITQAEKFLK